MENYAYQKDYEHCRASANLRFVNYLVDLAFFYAIMFFAGMGIEILYPGSVSGLDINPLVDRLFSLVLYGIVMFLIEFFFRGKSIGKLITGTRAVNLDGTDIELKDLFLRNIIRAIPFNAFSAFGTPCNPWHDVYQELWLLMRKN